MSNISEALKRAEKERDRHRPHNPDATAPEESPRGAGLAGVILRQKSKPAPAAGDSDSPIAAPTPKPPVTTLADALRNAPIETPAAVKHEQRAAETIVEDYSSKRRLNLPSSIVVYHERSGKIAEQYRHTRDTLMKANPTRQSQALVITSTRAGEGKTTTALNLALSLAEVRANRVLLIDACLHGGGARRTLSGLLHEHAAAGLAEVLASTRDDLDNLEPFLKPTPWHNLHLLPAGARSTPASAANLLQSQNLKAFLRRARTSFDWILLDAPPALRLPDAGLLATATDGILLALALHRTPQSQAQKTIRRLQSMNLHVKGTILTRA